MVTVRRTGHSGIEEELLSDSSQQRLIDLLLPLGGAVGLELLCHPQQQRVQVLGAAVLHEDAAQALDKPGTLQVIPTKITNVRRKRPKERYVYL